MSAVEKTGDTPAEELTGDDTVGPSVDAEMLGGGGGEGLRGGGGEGLRGGGEGLRGDAKGLRCDDEGPGCDDEGPRCDDEEPGSAIDGLASSPPVVSTAIFSTLQPMKSKLIS
jgi:hypothetical protein